jgi:nitrite reductase/ring-hydroxylating ferredoxin subunit
VEEVPEGGATAREIDSASGGFSVLLTRVEGVVQAFHNECPHAGRRLDWAPGRFLIEGDTLVCAAHGACFALRSGEFRGGLARGSGLTPIAVQIDDGVVYLG